MEMNQINTLLKENKHMRSQLKKYNSRINGLRLTWRNDFDEVGFENLFNKLENDKNFPFNLKELITAINLLLEPI